MMNMKAQNEFVATSAGKSKSPAETGRTKDDDEDFFSCLKQKHSSDIQPSEVQVNTFLALEPSRTLTATSFPYNELKAIFISLNTPIPSSAAVERVFSVGKEILRPKRARLSDKNFETLLFF